MRETPGGRFKSFLFLSNSSSNWLIRGYAESVRTFLTLSVF